jgi:hypothetical protein
VREVWVFAEFLIQETIVLRREGFREIRIEGREIVWDNKILGVFSQRVRSQARI